MSSCKVGGLDGRCCGFDSRKVCMIEGRATGRVKVWDETKGRPRLRELTEHSHKKM